MKRVMSQQRKPGADFSSSSAITPSMLRRGPLGKLTPEQHQIVYARLTAAQLRGRFEI